MVISPAIEAAIQALSSLPSIGRKSAQRLVFHLLRQSDDHVIQLAKALVELKRSVHTCEECFGLTESPRCLICSSHKRDRSTLCVVEEPNDVFSIEKTGEYRGLYHVLHGALNPMEGIGPQDIKLRELVERAGGDEVTEIILALNPSVEGEVTSQYVSKLLRPLGLKVTRLARGLPVGLDLEYTDEATLSRAFIGRTEV